MSNKDQQDKGNLCPRCKHGNDLSSTIEPCVSCYSSDKFEEATELEKALAKVDKLREDNKKLAYKGALREQVIEDLEKANETLNLVIESEKRSHSENVKDFGPIVDACNGHTPENIREIMKAVPPAEILKGSRLEVKCSGETMKTDEVAMWAPCIYVYPIVEYIEGDEITEKVTKGLRLPCKVSNNPEACWINAHLIYVGKSTGSKKRFFAREMGHDTATFNEYCRIRKIDIPES